jgi:GPH family glycoside/pentoside/hexuronide:cation symporter
MATTNKQRWLYSIANLGNVIPYQAVGTAILFYYTDVKHLPASWAAIVMTVYAFYNAFNNPVLGYLSDRTKSRWGRRVPYMLFGMLPEAIFFAFLFFAPFDGRQNPVSLVVWFSVGLVMWEGLGTAVSTGYYSLLPEMFRTYDERTDVAARMNIIQTVGLLVAAALPAALAGWIGWPLMAVCFAVLATAAMYVGIPSMMGMGKGSEGEEESLPLIPALKATLVNRSFLTVTVAQTMRFYATATLSTGMMFFVKYSVKLNASYASVALASAFVAAGIAMWPWRMLLGKRFCARTNLLIAYSLMAVAVLPLALAKTFTGLVLASAFVGIALAGLILMGDVILAEVIDEDEVKTGKRRAGMYFGMNSLITTLSSALVAIVFGILLPSYGYNTTLDTQPDSVAMGFRVFMTIPTAIGSILAVIALVFYPLHGERLDGVKMALARKQAQSERGGAASVSGGHE